MAGLADHPLVRVRSAPEGVIRALLRCYVAPTIELLIRNLPKVAH
jgi:hypothetical protein